MDANNISVIWGHFCKLLKYKIKNYNQLQHNQNFKI